MPEQPRQDWQKIRASGFDPEALDLDAQTVQKHWLSNLWIRTVTFLFGLHEGQAVHIKATADGALITADVDSSLTAYDVKTGAGPDAHGATGQLAPTGGAKRWDFLIETEDAKVKFLEPDAVTYYAEIPLVVGYYSIPIDSPGVSLVNRVSGVTCAFHIAAFH